MADVTAIRAVHDCLRHEFARLPLTVKAVADGDTARAAVVADHIALLTALLAGVGRGEDALWPVLAERAPDSTSTVEAITAQHAELAPILDAVPAQSQAWSESASATDRAAIHTTLIALEKRLLPYFALSEQQVLPLVERNLTQAELDEITAASRGDLTDDQLTLAYGLVLADTTASAAAAFAASASARLTAAYAGGGKARFDDYRARLTAY